MKNRILALAIAAAIIAGTLHRIIFGELITRLLHGLAAGVGK